MEAGISPASSARIRVYAWALATLGLGIAAFSQTELGYIVFGISLAAFALLITDEHLVWCWICPECGHHYPVPNMHPDPVVRYQWKPVSMLTGLAGFMFLGLGGSVILAYTGLDTALFGATAKDNNHLIIALAYAAVLAFAVVIFEGMDRYRQEPLVWRETYIAMLLLGLVATINLAVSINRATEEVLDQRLLLGVLVVGEALILAIAMRRSRLFVVPEIPDDLSDHFSDEETILGEHKKLHKSPA